MSDTASTSETSNELYVNEKPNWGATLFALMAATILLHGIIWTTGVRDFNLADAVERGAGKVEGRQKGEESEDVIRKSINMQRDTLPFWTVITLIGDFLFAPCLLFLRPLMVAVAFAALAAATGRNVRFPVVMSDCVNWQGVWVLGLAIQVVLMLVLWRSHIETSAALLLPAGEYPANTWVTLQQLDIFAFLGWMGMASVGWQRGQTNWYMAILTCLFLWGMEIMVVASASLMVNLGMRSSLMPS